MNNEENIIGYIFSILPHTKEKQACYQPWIVTEKGRHLSHFLFSKTTIQAKNLYKHTHIHPQTHTYTETQIHTNVHTHASLVKTVHKQSTIPTFLLLQAYLLKELSEMASLKQPIRCAGNRNCSPCPQGILNLGRGKRQPPK